MATNWLPAMRALGEYQGVLSSIRRAEARFVMSSEAEKYAPQVKRVEDLKLTAQQAWKRYTATVSTDEERGFQTAIEAAQGEYLANAGQLMSMNHADAGFDTAGRARYDKGLAPFNTLIDTLARDVEFQTRGGDGAYHASQNAFEQTRWAVVVLLVVALGVGAALALLITRSITAPIARAVTVAETVAAGDLRSDVRIDSDDETGGCWAR